jgi:hypothetical protein
MRGNFNQPSGGALDYSNLLMDLRSMFPAITLCGGQITGDSLSQMAIILEKILIYALSKKLLN